MTSEDQVFVAQHKNSEHFRVFTRLIKESQALMLNTIAGAKTSEQLWAAQGIIRGMNALENTLKTGIAIGDALLKESEK